jgi:2-dehydro-3-deoxyphosphogalactonate aldolase
MTDFASALSELPLVAILRGIRPSEVEAIGGALVEAGFRLIEVPLNSPDPFTSIEVLARLCGEDALVGAGTVMKTEQVETVRNAGGRMIVSPNTNAKVIEATVAARMASLPGYATPSEAFAALDAGATALKLFPAEAASPAGLRAQRAVLPPDTPVLAVGGITYDGMTPWLEAGARGFGLGSALYTTGLSPNEVAKRAAAFVVHWRQHGAGV